MQQVLDVLTEAVLSGAARILETRQRESIDARYKDATELVTQADLRSDAAMLAVFQARFPTLDPTVSFHLEESGVSGTPGARRVGADPLDGTSHFAAGGNLYSVQAHYIEDGVPLVGVVFQPEAFLPLGERAECMGRIVSAIRGEGAFVRRSEFLGEAFRLGDARRVARRPWSRKRTFVACVAMTGKMAPEERALAQRVHDSGIIGSMTGTGGAGGNVMMTIFGGQDVYANFGAGEDLDLVPPQVIAEEVGLTVWGPNRRSPVWHVRKQPFVVAPDAETAELFLMSAGL